MRCLGNSVQSDYRSIRKKYSGPEAEVLCEDQQRSQYRLSRESKEEGDVSRRGSQRGKELDCVGPCKSL